MSQRKRIKYAIGMIINIYNHSPSGKRIFEGKAQLVEFVSETETMEAWLVSFFGGEPGTFTRYLPKYKEEK